MALDIEAIEETGRDVLRRMRRLERQIAKENGFKGNVAAQIVDGLKDGSLTETKLVSAWLAEFSAFVALQRRWLKTLYNERKGP